MKTQGNNIEKKTLTEEEQSILDSIIEAVRNKRTTVKCTVKDPTSAKNILLFAAEAFDNTCYRRTNLIIQSILDGDIVELKINPCIKESDLNELLNNKS